MAEFSQKRGQQRDEVLGGTVDFLLANARLVLGVGGAAVLGIATLAVKRLIDRATSPRDEDDTKGDTTCLEESWKELSLLKATPRLPPRPPPAALSQPVSLPGPSPSTPGERHTFPSGLGGCPFGGHFWEMQPRLCQDCATYASPSSTRAATACVVMAARISALLPPGWCSGSICHVYSGGGTRARWQS